MLPRSYQVKATSSSEETQPPLAEDNEEHDTINGTSFLTTIVKWYCGWHIIFLVVSSQEDRVADHVSSLPAAGHVSLPHAAGHVSSQEAHMTDQLSEEERIEVATAYVHTHTDAKQKIRATV